MKLIIGLGNPGETYQNTRHNLGFMIVDKFLKDFEPVNKTVWEDSKKFKSYIAKLEWQPRHARLQKVVLAKPKTYMNNSGLAVLLISEYFKIAVSDIWIMHDDIDLPLGSMKIRLGGSSAGHKGVESIIKVLNNDKFWRFRLGIGHPKQIQNSLAGQAKFKVKNYKNAERYVLGKFTGGEWGKARELIKRGSKAIEMALEESLQSAMNRFNTK